MRYPEIKVFYIESTNRYRRTLRHYASGLNGEVLCPGRYKTFHNASVFVGEIEQDTAPTCRREELAQFDHRWPTKCDYCDYVFREEDEWQVNYTNVYVAADGREMTLHDAPPGACWDAWWMYDDHHNAKDRDWCTGPDGRCLVVVLPNGNQWMLDYGASNCTRPDDRVHKCWIRHGRPEDGTLHVDKNGNTCGAGDGSIISGDYLGYLRNGCFSADLRPPNPVDDAT